MTERFQKAYTALVNAYHGETLAKGSCAACACGNIINAALGLEITQNDITGNLSFLNHNRNNPKVSWSFKRSYAQGKPLFGYGNEVNEAGYTVEEFCKIETAFENNTLIQANDYCDHTEKEILEDQFNGLNAVMDVLLELDNIGDGTKLKTDLKAHPKLVVQQP